MIPSKWAALAVAIAMIGTTTWGQQRAESDEYGPQLGDWEFTLSGSGTSDRSLDAGNGSIDVSLGYFVFEMLELGVRQSVSYSKATENAESNWGGATRGFADIVFDLKALRPYVGASVGYLYGDNTNDTWAGGLEAGVKFYVKPQTFIFGSVEYLWFFDSGSEVDDTFDDGRFAYTAGVGFNF